MKTKGKTKAQLLQEIADMSLRLAELEKSEAKRAEAEKALRESEELYRTLIETSPDPILMYSLRGEILAANVEAAKTYGVSSVDAFLQEVKTVFDLLTDDGKTHAEANFHRTLTKGYSQKNEYIVRLRNGTLIPTEINSSLVRTSTGEPRAFISVIRDITNRKRAEEELQQSEKKYRFLFENAGESIFVAQEGMLKLVNAKTEEITGFTREELISRSFLDFIHPDDRTMVLDRHIQRQDGASLPSKYSFRIISRSGDTLWVEINVVLIEWDEKPATLNFLSDITERKRAEEALQQSEKKFRDLAELLPQAVFEFDLQGRFTYVNRSALKMFGYEQADYQKGVNAADVIAPDDRERAAKNIVRIMRAELQTGTEYTALRKNGVEFPVIIYSTPIRMDEKISGLRGIVVDFTERKQMEDALRESEEKYSTLVRQAKDGVILIQDTLVIFANEALADILGYTIDELENTPYINYVAPESRALVAAQVNARLSGDNVLQFYEAKLLRKDGTVIDAELTAKVIHYRGKPTDLGIIRDVTERKRAEDEKRKLEERLQRAEKMESLGTLAGGVAHDLNNVLGIVLGYAEMLLMDVHQSSPIRPHLMNIMKGGEKAAAIVQDLLTLARRGVPSRQVLNLNSVIADCQQSREFEKLSTYHPSVVIKTDLEPHLLNISGSPVHLVKSLFNLVSNASEAMPNGGTVTIKTANQYIDRPIEGYDEVREGDYAVLSVSDEGEGIPETDLTRIFEPFYTKKVMGRSGTGLGLAVVWGTVKDHHGYINVQSKEGKGSMFSLYFPVTREGISAETVPLSMSEYMGKGESVLIVDDIREQRDLAAEMLRKLNYTVTSISSGEEAVAYLKDHRADLMVLDMIMAPGMDGLDTYLRVLTIHPGQKAIIVSGFSETDRVSMAQALGAGAYVKKPYILEKLGLAVRKELDRSA